MEENYYDQTLKKLRGYMAKADYFSAMKIISEELGMPYMPKEFEDELKAHQKTIQKALKKEEGDLDQEAIASYLKADVYKQLLAIKALENKNLRQYLDVIREYLVSSGDERAKTLLVASLIDQEIGEELVVNKKGVAITFIPKYAESVDMSDGYLEGVQYLKAKLANDDPIMYKMALDILGRHIFAQLPLGVSADEGIFYAKAIVIYLLEAFGKCIDADAFLKIESDEHERKMLLEVVNDLKSA